MSTTPLHVWQHGHVGKHRTYGIVTVFDIEEPTGATPTVHDARYIQFINEDGVIHTQRDDGKEKIGVDFLYDSGHVIPDDGYNLYVNTYVNAFTAGLFGEPAQNTTVPAPPAPPAPVVDQQATKLADDLRLANPEATVRVEPVPHQAKPNSRVVRMTGTGLNLMALMNVGRYGLVIEDLRGTRSAANAVIAVVCKPLDQ